MKKPKLLPLDVFLATFTYAPRLAVGLIILNAKDEILLARRAIPSRKGVWHIPGGFVLKGEPVLDCVRRVADKELGVSIKPAAMKLLGLFDDIDKDPRGHAIDAMYEIKITIPPKPAEETQELKFFKKMPAQIGFNHGDILHKLGYR